MIFGSSVLVLLLCLIATDLLAQELKPEHFHESSVKVFPYAYYTPETQLAFGAGGILTFYVAPDTIVRPSSVGLSAYYTTNDQWKVSLSPKVYFSRNQRYAALPMSFGKYQSKFWGIGNDSPDIPESPYIEQVADVRLEFQSPPLIPIFDRSGLIYHLENNDIVDEESNPFLLDGSVPGSEGGLLSGAGVSFVVDSRNLTFYPNKGRLYTISFLYYANALGSDFEFSHLKIDLREYFRAWGKWGVIAVQLYGEIVAGSPPFYKTPALGGGNRGRGYFYGRFRDKTFLTAQVEYRRHLWRKFGGVLFVGPGQVGPDLSSYRLDAFHVSYGFGVRYLFNPDEHVNIRMDIGFGKDDSTNGVYFAVEEAF